MNGIAVMTVKEAITGMIPACSNPEVKKELEIAIVDISTGENKLGKLSEDGEFVWMGLPYKKYDERAIYSWKHTDRTMLIILR